MGPGINGKDGKVVGFIDIGTYSVRLLLVRLNPNRSYTILSEQKESVRLGGGEFIQGRLEPEAMDRAALVCTKFARMARGFGARRIIAVATAATREAKNQRLFVHRLRAEAGLDVRVVSGKEEARLIYLGVSYGMHLDGRRALFIDVGGGSTELIVGDEREPAYLSSLELGAIRLSQRFHLDRPDKPIGPQRYAAVRRYVRGTAVRTVQEVRKLKFDLCVGSSGTIVNLAQIAAKALPGRGKDRELALRHSDLREVSRLLCSLPLDERRQVPGINPNRADILIGGAAVIETLMEELQIERLVVSPRTLRDGLLVDYIARKRPGTLGSDVSPRLRSVLLLGRRCGFDEVHARVVARLALCLFDSAKKASLHDYGPRERELLQCAALLHDIGTFLSYQNHQEHSYYLIRNADLVGFDQTEIALIAALARYHTRGTPQKGLPLLVDLQESGQVAVVLRLGVLLRIAETLDRSHTGVVRGAKLVRQDRKNVSLELTAEGDCALEVWGVQKHAGAFKKAFDCRLAVPPADFLETETAGLQER